MLRVLGERTRCVVIKDGGGGAYGIESGVVIHSPALPITPLDTTGAGDVFDAGFLAARLEGRSLADCLAWGNVVGGLLTLGAGGTGRVVMPCRRRSEARGLLGRRRSTSAAGGDPLVPAVTPGQTCRPTADTIRLKPGPRPRRAGDIGSPGRAPRRSIISTAGRCIRMAFRP